MSLPMQTHQNHHALATSISEILKEQGIIIDQNRLQDAVMAIDDNQDAQSIIKNLLSNLGLDEGIWHMPKPDAAFMPLIAHHQVLGFGHIVNYEQGRWFFVTGNQTHHMADEGFDFVGKIHKKPQAQSSSFGQLLKQNIFENRSVMLEAAIASFIISFLALAVSFFSMQVYDRVIPTRSEATLVVLGSGVALVILFEAFMKFARSKVMDKMVVSMDQNLSRSVFERLLGVRVDKMPNSVGSLAAQLRGYEQVRSFFTASTLFTLVDLPMSLLFIVAIAIIGSPLIAAVPLIAALIGVFLGLKNRDKIDAIAKEGAQASYQKTGVLVEAVEGIETIKAGSGQWRFLSRWLEIMNTTTTNDLKMRHAGDNLNYSVQMLQQVSYVCIVIVGSYVVMAGNMTIGGLIASTILGGRILAPIMNVPNMLVQYSHAKAAKANIESLFEVQQDNQGVEYPLAPSKIYGNYQCKDISFSYADNDRSAITIDELNIKAGEKVAILGSIGSGKSTLLKLLSGLYGATKGHILLDGLDINQISRQSMSNQVGYLQQDHRLFEGSLRDNLLIGMTPPDDDFLNNTLRRTGLMRLVSGHSSGLDLKISEGGKGLSGGQKQLVAFTRMVLTQPSVWLLDEPTASMDNNQEQQCLYVLAQEFQDPNKTLIVSTHKPALLALVDRIIIMSNGQVAIDGPKNAVLEQLQRNEQAARERVAQAQSQAQTNQQAQV
ncbi:ATP-binding cassette domain-containing protein [Moraxella bovoculi]|uniref:ATP-binding cassette domain-containing protein n=1 Tax=Moraxella bovoculi TaxID=386891 RepID=UPI003F4FC7C5